jgi:hypothetical protein
MRPLRSFVGARPVWFPLGVYAASRLMVLGVTQIALQYQVPKPGITGFVNKWDATYYLSIARNGYDRELWRDGAGDLVGGPHAFLPLYPWSIRLADRLLPASDVFAAIVVNLVGGAVAAVLLWRLACKVADSATADRTLLVLCFFPGTVALNWPYSEGLMLALFIGAILLLVDERWLWASALGALATATRPNAVPLVLACAWVAWRVGESTTTRRAARAAAAAVLSASGFVLSLVFIGSRAHDLRAWFRVEKEGFEEGTPWKRLPTTIADVFRDAATFNRVITLGFALIAVVLLVVGLRANQPGWMKLLTVAGLYFALSANIAQASPRLQLAAIPAFIALAARLRETTLALWIAGSATLLGVMVFAYGLAGPPLYMFAP